MALSANEKQTAHLQVRTILPEGAITCLTLWAIFHDVNEVSCHQILIRETEMLLKAVKSFFVSKRIIIVDICIIELPSHNPLYFGKSFI